MKAKITSDTIILEDSEKSQSTILVKTKLHKGGFGKIYTGIFQENQNNIILKFIKDSSSFR